MSVFYVVTPGFLISKQMVRLVLYRYIQLNPLCIVFLPDLGADGEMIWTVSGQTGGIEPKIETSGRKQFLVFAFAQQWVTKPAYKKKINKIPLHLATE